MLIARHIPDNDQIVRTLTKGIRIAKFYTNLRRARSSGVRLSNRLRFRGQPGSLGGSRRIAGLMSAIFCYFNVNGRVFSIAIFHSELLYYTEYKSLVICYLRFSHKRAWFDTGIASAATKYGLGDRIWNVSKSLSQLENDTRCLCGIGTLCHTISLPSVPRLNRNR